MADEYYLYYGKSNATKIVCNKGDILRVASEEVLKTDNEGFPYYRGYISVPLQKVPEKNVSDTLDVLDKLSSSQPKRIPMEEVARIEHSEYSPELQQEDILPSGNKSINPSSNNVPNENEPGDEQEPGEEDIGWMKKFAINESDGLIIYKDKIGRIVKVIE
jgi:hypothetical protein